MRKIILTVLTFTGLVSISCAQEADSRGTVVFGLKAGTNYSNVYDAVGRDFEADPKFGLAAGLFFSIPVGTFLGIQPEVLFSQKGFNATGTFMGSRYDFTRTTNYIDVPILLAIKPVEFLTVVAGPQYSYLLSQQDKFSGTFFTSTQADEFENDNLRKNTLCFTGGADINIRHLVLGLRVGWDVRQNHGDGSSDTPRYKNVWYQATLGFRLYNI